MAALLSSEIGKTDKIPILLNEARSMGLTVLPPDINASMTRFAPLDKAIRFGLAGIKNVGEGAAEAIVRERETGGAFKSLMDFCLRMDSRLINRKVIETLVRCGAGDFLGMHRARLFTGIELAMRRAESIRRDQQTGQGHLFELPADSPDTNGAEGVLADCCPWPEKELLAAEKELLGFYISGHPLAQYERLLKIYRLATVADLAELAEGSMSRIGGLVTQVEQTVTKDKKELMAIIQITDMKNDLKVLVFPRAFAEYGQLLVEGAPVMVCGTLANNKEMPTMRLTEAYPLDQAPQLFTEHISLHLAAANAKETLLTKIKDLLQAHPGPIPVTVCLQFPAGEKVFLSTDRSLHVTPSEPLFRELEQIVGQTGFYVAAQTRPGRKANAAPRRRQQPG